MTVRATGLEALLAEHGIEPRRIAFVWADVQGSECDVIESAPALWAAGVPLFCEVDPGLWANGGDPGKLSAPGPAAFLALYSGDGADRQGPAQGPRRLANYRRSAAASARWAATCCCSSEGRAVRRASTWR